MFAEWWITSILIFGSLIVAMASGVPVAFAFLIVDILWSLVFMGGRGLEQLASNIFSSVSTFTMLPVPLFILMGEIMFRSGMGARMIEVLNKWFGRVPGRESVLAVGAGTIFAALSGSTIGSTVMLGTTLLPIMRNHNYKTPMIVGPIVASGCLAILIPPSALSVILGGIANISIAGLLIGGILPGVIMAFLYALYIIIRCIVDPSLAPSGEIRSVPFSEKVKDSLLYLLPLGFVIFLVIGLILLGIATPSEAAATGTFGSIILAAFYRKLNLTMLKESLLETLNITVMVLIIMAGTVPFSQILAISGSCAGLAKFVVSLPLPPIAIVVGTQLVLIFLGMFIGTISMIMITMPIFMPIINALGIDPLWFGLLTLINMEISVISPPFGMNLFAMKGIAPHDITMGDIYRGGLPFIAIDLFVLALLLISPKIALWLPGLIR